MDTTTLLCGIGCLRAVWMNRFATVKSFITVYSILGMIQSMSYAYFSVTLTTLEKRFKIPGKTLGIILSGNEVSQILLSLVLSYYGGTRNRPVWIAVGTLSSALSCFVLALPHFLYGPGEDAIRLTKQYISATGADIHALSQYGKHEDPILHCYANKPPQDCSTDVTSGYSVVPLVLIFLSQFILGIGTTLFYVLGQTYIDDNTEKKDAPRLLGISLALRMVGPSFGFLLGFLCLRLYIDPTLDPIIKHEDPRWMGAWWIGWIICGSLMAITSFVLAMFPRQLPRKKDRLMETTKKDHMMETVPLKIEEKTEVNEPQKLKSETNFKEFPKALGRLLGNKILMNNIFSSVFAILGASMLITYFIKYIEIQFHRSSSNVSIVAGPIILFGSMVGLLGSGTLISKFKPPPKYLLLWNVFGGLGFICGQIAFIFLGCDSYNIQSYSGTPNVLDFNSPCNAMCDCSNVKFSPVCYEPEMITYFSPCHAGCTTVENSNKIYSNCSCIPSGSSSSPYFNETIPNVLKNGFCDSSCTTAYYAFVAILASVNFLGTSGKIGNMLVNYRSVDIKDKAFAQGFALWMVSLFALIPGPIIYGWIFDNACLIWDQRCSHRGNCWFYEKDKLRLTVNITGILFTSIAMFFDILVWKHGKNLNFYKDNDFFPISIADTKDNVENKENLDSKELGS